MQIFGIEIEDQLDVEFVKEKWLRLSKNNNPDANGSEYLYHKIKNARDCLAKELNVKPSAFKEDAVQAEEEIKEKETKDENDDHKKSN